MFLVRAAYPPDSQLSGGRFSERNLSVTSNSSRSSSTRLRQSSCIQSGGDSLVVASSMMDGIDPEIAAALMALGPVGEDGGSRWVFLIALSKMVDGDCCWPPCSTQLTISIVFWFLLHFHVKI
jgi:hypothetical protein